MADVTILTPYYIDQPMPGLEALLESGWLLNRPALPAGDPQEIMSVLHRGLAERVQEAVRRGDRPVSVAGDCCSSIGVLAGLQRAGVDPYLIWLDAHGDFNTWETTPSGFLGGMPLAMLVGLGEQRMPQAVALRNIPQRDVLLCDGRDLDPGERDLLARSQVLHVDRFMGLLETGFPDRPLYVHFDTDLIDPRQAPAMNYPAAGGPSAEQVAAAFRQLARTGRLAAASLSSWNPAMDPDGSTQALCMGLLAELLA